MHKKGAKLSLVHLFGFSKINRNYIQKGREIRRNMKRMKRVLIVVLAGVMLVAMLGCFVGCWDRADRYTEAEHLERVAALAEKRYMGREANTPPSRCTPSTMNTTSSATSSSIFCHRGMFTSNSTSRLRRG